MKTILRNLLLYTLIGLLFTGIIVYIYDGNLSSTHIIFQGTLLFISITLFLERIMMIFYVKIRLPVVVRVQLTVIISTALYTFGVWLTRPWLIKKIFNLPIFLVTIFPMFLTFSILFEIYFQSSFKSYNDKLNQLKNKKLSNK